MLEVLLGGLLLGGMYGLVALGLNMQYGVARILNLAYGEFLIGGSFIAFFTVIGQWQLNPLLSLFMSVPIAFALSWLIYRCLMMPLVRRAPDQDALDADVVLVTFGLFFVLQGLALVNWSGDLRGSVIGPTGQTPSSGAIRIGISVASASSLNTSGAVLPTATSRPISPMTSTPSCSVSAGNESMSFGGTVRRCSRSAVYPTTRSAVSFVTCPHGEIGTRRTRAASSPHAARPTSTSTRADTRASYSRAASDTLAAR